MKKQPWMKYTHEEILEKIEKFTTDENIPFWKELELAVSSMGKSELYQFAFHKAGGGLIVYVAEQMKCSRSTASRKIASIPFIMEQYWVRQWCNENIVGPSSKVFKDWTDCPFTKVFGNLVKCKYLIGSDKTVCENTTTCQVKGDSWCVSVMHNNGYRYKEGFVKNICFDAFDGKRLPCCAMNEKNHTILQKINEGELEAHINDNGKMVFIGECESCEDFREDDIEIQYTVEQVPGSDKFELLNAVYIGEEDDTDTDLDDSDMDYDPDPEDWENPLPVKRR